MRGRNTSLHGGLDHRGRSQLERRRAAPRRLPWALPGGAVRFWGSPTAEQVRQWTERSLKSRLAGLEDRPGRGRTPVSQRAGRQERLRTIYDQDTAVLQLHEACMVLLDDAYGDAQLRSTIFARVSKQCLAEAVACVGALARPLDDGDHVELMEQYRRIRR